jgi:ABC-type polysaccharide/polyol phosphate export permease
LVSSSGIGGATRGVARVVAANRRLLRTFVARDLAARYAGSSLGIFWSVIHPLVLLALYIVVFSTIMRGGRFQVSGQPVGYALFLVPALIAWNWLNESLIGACNSVVANSSLIKKTVFPAEILPASAIMAGAVPFAAAMALFLVFAAVIGALHWTAFVLVPLLALLQLLLMLGPAYLLAAAQVFARDTAQLLTAGFQFLFWASPVVYPEEVVQKAFPWAEWWFRVNPVAHLVNAYRDALIAHRAPSAASVIYLLVLALLMWHAGRTVFLRTRRLFPDEV